MKIFVLFNVWRCVDTPAFLSKMTSNNNGRGLAAIVVPGQGNTDKDLWEVNSKFVLILGRLLERASVASPGECGLLHQRPSLHGGGAALLLGRRRHLRVRPRRRHAGGDHTRHHGLRIQTGLPHRLVNRVSNSNQTKVWEDFTIT